jgi:glyoxylate/hydroxypyruvate reductase
MRKLAVVHSLHQDWVPALQEAESRLEVRGWHPRDAPDPGWLRDAEGLFVWRIPEGLTDLMPRLAWVQNSGAGVDHLVDDPAIPPGVPITRADGQFGFWMARYVAGHLLNEAQALEASRKAQAARAWYPRLLPEDLTGRVALVSGFGRIGRQIGTVLRDLGMDVQGFVHTPRQDPHFPLHAPGALERWLPEARVLVLCAPLTPATRRMVDARLLAHGNPGLTLVNVGRGELVVIPDLLQALDEGHLGRAVLDVFPVEPLDPGSPLWTHPKVTVTPHHSGPSTPKAMVPELVPNLRRFAEGLPIQDAVDRARGY